MLSSDTKDPILLKTLDKIHNVYECGRDVMKTEDELKLVWQKISSRLGVNEHLEDRDIENMLGLYESQYSNICYYMYYSILMLVKEKYPDIQIQDIFKKAYEHFKTE